MASDDRFTETMAVFGTVVAIVLVVTVGFWVLGAVIEGLGVVGGFIAIILVAMVWFGLADRYKHRP